MSLVTSRRVATHSFIVLALLVVSLAARAQDVQHATIALVRELPDTTARASIIRTADRALILMRERDADAATLATAMSSLYRSRANDAVAPGTRIVITLHNERQLTALPPNERQLGELYLAKLHASRIADLDEFGSARLTTIPLAPPRKIVLH